MGGGAERGHVREAGEMTGTFRIRVNNKKKAAAKLRFREFVQQLFYGVFLFRDTPGDPWSAVPPRQ